MAKKRKVRKKTPYDGPFYMEVKFGRRKAAQMSPQALAGLYQVLRISPFFAPRS